MAITASQAQGLVLALFGASAGGHLTGLTGASSLTTLAADLSMSAGLILDRNLSDNTAFRDLVLTTNLKLTGTALTEAQKWMDGEFTKGTSRADILTAAVTYLDGLTDTTNVFYASAAAYRTTVANAVTWSQGAGATVTSVATLMAQQGTASTAQGQTFTLTTATDILVGTAGNDTFTGAATTTGSSDSLIDQTTTDSDVAQLTGQTADIANTFTIKNVEAVEVTAAKVGGTYTVNADKFSGVNTLTVSRGAVADVITGSGAVTVTGLSQAVKAVKAGAGVTALTVTQNLSTMTAAGIAVDAADVTGDVTVTGAATVTANKVGATKTVALQGTGTATLDAANVKVDAAAAGTVNVGTTTATTGTVEINAAAATTIGASVAGGGVINAGAATSITVTAVDDSGITINNTKAQTKSSAGVYSGTVDLAGTSGTTDAATVNVAGYNNLTTNTSAQVEAITLSGNGAAATFKVTGAPSTYTLTGAQSITIENSATNLDGKKLTDSTTAGTTTVSVNGSKDGDTDLSKIAADVISLAVDTQNTGSDDTITFADAANIVLAKDQTALNLSGKTTKATLNLSTADDTAASGATIDLTVGAVALVNAATTNLTASVGKFTATSINTDLDGAGGGTTLGDLFISGSKAVQLNSGAGVLKAKSIDAQLLTGKLTAIQTADSVSLKAGSGADDITLNGAAVISTATNDGDDTVTLTAASDGSTITTGAGDDTVAVNAANVVAINTGDGADTVTIGNVDADGVYDGGAGSSDSLVFGTANALGLYNNANFAFSNFETVNISAANNAISINEKQLGSQAIKLKGDSATDILIIRDSDVSSATASASNKYAAASANNVLDASNITVQTGGANVTIQVGQGSNTVVGTAAATDTVDVSLMYTDGTITGVIDKDATTNTVASAGVVVNLGTSAIANSTILSNATMYTGTSVTSVAAGSVSYLYASNPTATTASNAVSTLSGIENITGSAGKDYLVGNALDNAINGGDGVDWINGGAGADTITGGDGADTIYGGAGDDTIALASTNAASDTVRFEATAAGNGADTITGFASGATAGGGDVLNFAAFINGAGTTVTGVGTGTSDAYQIGGTGAAATGNVIVAWENGSGAANGTFATGDFGTGAGKLNITKGVVLYATNTATDGSASAATTISIYYVDASLGGASSTAVDAATDIVLVGTMTGVTNGVEALLAANIAVV